MAGWLPKRAPQKIITFFVTKNFGMPKDSSNSKYLYGGLFTFIVFIQFSFNLHVGICLQLQLCIGRRELHTWRSTKTITYFHCTCIL